LVTLIRFTVTDGQGTASFVGPCHAIKMLVAACTRGPKTIVELLEFARRYDDQFATQILNGLSVFDEHNLRENTAEIDTKISSSKAAEWPPFRVYNEITHRASTQPVQAGLIVFNLMAKRIIQVQNSYAEILRRDRGRLRENGRPIHQLYHYDLPNEWALVP
jgi:hypothetical protein